MSERSRRVVQRFDYRVYSKTGKKVYKAGSSELAVMGDLIEEELKISCKINRFLNEFELELLYDIKDIEGGIKEFRDLIESYENVHVMLQKGLAGEYEETYKEYGVNITKLTNWVRNARLEIKKKKVENVKNSEDKVNAAEEKVNAAEEKKCRQAKEESEKSLNKEKEMLRVEERRFSERIRREIENINNEGSTFIVDILKNINDVKGLMREYADIILKIDGVFGPGYRDIFNNDLDQQNNVMNTCVREMMEKVQTIKLSEKKEKETLEKSLEKENYSGMKIDKIAICNNLSNNIDDRILNLEHKCKIKFDTLTDCHILERKKDLKTLDSEFNNILDRITKLSEARPSEFEETNELLTKLDARRKGLRASIDLYQNDLEKEIIIRDLTEEKLKNASILKIDLPKFKGYNSSMDYYTFKSEFEKLILPRVQAKLLPDYLKNNYLDGQALETVKEINNIDKMWERLESSFGNVSFLLSNKLRELEIGVPLWKVKSDEKLVQLIMKLKNSMIELSCLAKKHGIEASLFHMSNLTKIYNLIGRKRQTEIVKQMLDTEMTDQQKWEKIVKFLDNEQKLKEQMILFEKSIPVIIDESVRLKNGQKSQKSSFENSQNSKSYVSSSNTKECVICHKSDHVVTTTSKGSLLVNYFACDRFVKMTPKERLRELKTKRLCFQCLTPGLKAHHDGRCFDKYACPDESHKRFPSGLHVLICDRHKGNKANLEMLEDYKAKYITNPGTLHKDFSKNITISLHVEAENNDSYGAHSQTSQCDESDMAIYKLQTIRVGNQNLNLFYDSGCQDMVCKKEAVDYLQNMKRAKCILNGPLMLSGVGDQKSICKHGKYQIAIPLHNGKDINLCGICLDKVTGTFPSYPLIEIEREIQREFTVSGGNPNTLPRLPNCVGGDTDIMIGIQYLKYFPEKIYSLPNGLSIYESQFLNPDGSRGIVGGPHKIFTEIHKSLGSHLSMSAYLTDIVQVYQNGYKLSLDISLLNMSEFTHFFCKNLTKSSDMEELVYKSDTVSIEELANDNSSDLGSEVHLCKKTLKCLKSFEEVESAGTEVSYRCVRCRGCPDCKKSENIECISIHEEVEQGIIDKSVIVNLEKGYTTAKLPFMCDPIQKLAPNEYIAKRVFTAQLRKLNVNPNDKQDVIKSEKKLHDLGFVEFLDNLSPKQQNKINSSPIMHFIPWHAVWNANSISTPCRLVFDASQATSTGLSLNNLVAKGRNNMNKLVEIVIRWLIRRYAFHTDIQKMYNTIRLDEEHWCYQLYLWQNELNLDLEPRIKVIKTLIYGVKSSGNQAERGLRQTADIQKNEYPRQNEVVNQDIYVDDCLSGEDSYETCRETTDGLEIMINKGGFRLKGVTFSGFDPPKNLSNGDNSVTVAGMKWYPKSDLISLNTSELNFGKKNRGKKVPKLDGLLPDKFTRRDCAGRVAEIFDLLGKFTPVTAGLKLDLSELSKRKLDWDDFVPNDLVCRWKSNFELITKLRAIKLKRTIVPEDAINLDIETLEMSDSSLNIACSAIYARFKRKNGLYSCQLVFARSKIVPDGMTIPRAELFAAVLNASTGHVVNLALSKYIKTRMSLTDSQIVLFWINNTDSPLKQWVRNRVIEINRLTNRENWFYIESRNMTADLGTRRGAKISDVSEDSPWINGQNWAKTEKVQFPIKSLEEIKLSKEELKGHDDELIKSNIAYNNRRLSVEYSESYAVLSKGVLNNIGERYKFSHYIIDPNKFRFRKVVRILSLVFLFIRNIKSQMNKSSNLIVCETKLPDQFKFSNDKYLVTHNKSVNCDTSYKCKKGLVVGLSEENLIIALNYFYKKASLEIKHFLNKNVYKNISKEKNGILYYTGRLLPTQEFNNQLNLSDVCIDLTMSTFCVPLIDKFSPLAYSLVNEIHWYNDDARHSGNETVMRYVQKVAHIIEGRSLVKVFRYECPRCRYLNKKAIDVAMGPIPSNNLCVAPAFYISQVDMFGPFNLYSNTNKRATTKIWFIIFCCCATGAVDIKVAEDYSTNSFILAFIRFSCKVGYPKKLLPDAGSQLVKGCQTMTLTFLDLSHKLHEYGVEFEVCPVGAHYMHGKVERKIRHVKESFSKCNHNHRLSIMQWETLGDQVGNSINNLPIAIGNIVQDLENLDILTPNRLMLARNNNRCPTGTIEVTGDIGKIIKRNNEIFHTWFKCWLISYVPTLMLQPKWYKSDKDPKVGDIILFLKSDREYDKQYQYGIIIDVKVSRDGKVRQIEVEYQNHIEKTKRRTIRGTREVVVIHPVGELGLVREINALSVYNCL